MKKTLVFIMSSNYSGSHFLSQLLGSNTQAIHVGEVKNVIKENHDCYVCGNTGSCELFKGLEDIPKQEIYSTLFERAPKGTNVLVDNSKKVGWVKQFLFLKQKYNIKIIFLLRDPRALSRRWAIRDISVWGHLRVRLKSARRYISSAIPILFSNPVYAYIYKWLEQNQRISEFVNNSGIDYKVVTYREVAYEKQKTLKELTEFIGLEYEEEQIDYWKFEHHGTQKPQYEWIKKQKDATHVDLRWKEFLTEKQQSTILHSNYLHKFFSELNIEMRDDGLYKK
ncbi:MAG: hypothetical protein KUG50_03650 [Cycloclasticus sp.]|nr:hypothetical protein [Cycloclasticus sp.]